jgi:hypothetical protein
MVRYTNRSYISDTSDSEDVFDEVMQYNIIKYNNMIYNSDNNKKSIYTSIRILCDNFYKPTKTYYNIRGNIVICKIYHNRNNYLDLLCESKISRYIKVLSQKSICKLNYGLIKSNDAIFLKTDKISQYLKIKDNIIMYIVRDIINNIDLLRYIDRMDNNSIEYYDINRGHFIKKGDRVLLHHIAI